MRIIVHVSAQFVIHDVNSVNARLQACLAGSPPISSYLQSLSQWSRSHIDVSLRHAVLFGSFLIRNSIISPTTFAMMYSCMPQGNQVCSEVIIVILTIFS